MMSGQAAELFAGIFGVPVGTALLRAKQLRAAGLLSKAGRGPRSGAHLTGMDAACWLLSLALDHGRGEDVAVNVSRYAAIAADSGQPIRPPYFVDGLSFAGAPTAGEAIAALIDNMRSPEFTDWSDAHPAWELTIAVCQPVAKVFVSLSQPREATPDRLMAGALLSFGLDGTQRAAVERQINIEARPFFTQLAEAMGPPD